MVASQTIKSFGTVRARAGVVLAPPLLLYGTGGFASRSVHENLRVPAVAPAAERGRLLLCLYHRHGLFRRRGIANLVRLERRGRRRVCDHEQPDLPDRTALCALERADGDGKRHGRRRRNGAGIHRGKFLIGLLRVVLSCRLELQILGRFSGHPFRMCRMAKKPERLR